MRAIVIALGILGGAAGAAPEDRLPREGSGWAGFGRGTWCKIKQSLWVTGRVPAVSITVSTLAEAGKETLKVTRKTVDMVGTEREETLVLPATGEAGPGERDEKREELTDEGVPVGDRTLPCARTRVTVAGPTMKRVITRWVARDPRVLVKKQVETLDAAGKSLSTETMLLTQLDAKFDVAGRTVRCLVYATRTIGPAGVGEGTVHVSRDVPQGLVREDSKVTKDGQVVYTLAFQMLDFELK